MSEVPFHEQCERTLRAIEGAIDTSGLEVDTSRSGQVLELEFDDGSKIIINGNEPVREIWVAARSGAFHYRSQAGKWVDTRSGNELFEALSRLVSQQAGETVTLSASP
ncbi:MAG: iron donor protein CyaY [Quisquiliibacterium sp.]